MSLGLMLVGDGHARRVAVCLILARINAAYDPVQVNMPSEPPASTVSELPSPPYESNLRMKYFFITVQVYHKSFRFGNHKSTPAFCKVRWLANHAREAFRKAAASEFLGFTSEYEPS